MKMNICTAYFPQGKKIKFRVQANDTKGLEAVATAYIMHITNHIPDRVEITECPVQVGSEVF